MLVLSRKIGEVIVIGSDVKVRVLTSNGSRVRLGIEAPREVSVNREEIQDMIDAKSRETAAVTCAG